MGVAHGRDGVGRDCFCFIVKEKGRQKRVLVTGASGLLGRQIMKLLNRQWEIRGLYSSRKRENMVHADLLQEGEIERQFVEFNPQVIIHSAAERRPDVVHKQPDKSRALNVDVTRGLAEACRKHNAWLINLSTDYVFDGEKPPYAVDAAANPLSAYGEQKVEGEKICIDVCPSSATVRIPLLFGPMEYVKESGVTAMYLELQKGVKKADHTQKRYPTYTLDVARILGKMIEVHFSGKKLNGIFHWQADECLTKYDMLMEIANIFQVDGSHIQKGMDQPKFPRPEDSRLDCSRLVEELGIDPEQYRTPFSTALRHSFSSFPNEALALDIRDKMEPELQCQYSQDEVRNLLRDMNISICDLTVQRLMNKEGKINKDDYMAFLHHNIEGS